MTVRAALFSIHDVMPSTLAAVEQIAGCLHEQGIRKLTLLVVPDTGWDDRSLERLAALEQSGADLAGHGWQHRIQRIRNARHWLHSTFISRNVAEHLALDRKGVVALMQDCADWFAARGMRTPTLYVPPAWAMGDAKREDLDALPYACYETLYGLYDASSQRFQRLPMVGFEADTGGRALACRLWNGVNLLPGQSAVRFSIHPGDFELRLAGHLRTLLEREWQPLYYGEMLAAKSQTENPRNAAS